MTSADNDPSLLQLVEAVGDFAIYMLDPEGRVISWNSAATRVKGWGLEEVEGQSFRCFFTPEDRRDGIPEKLLARARDEGRVESEGWRLRKDGSRFWASSSLHAVRDEPGGLVGFCKITRDVTERHDAQIELRKAQERLAQAQKMEAMGQLTGGVAHDFNNLLMIVSGQVQLLRKRLGDDGRALRALDAIELAARRGQDLTRQLLSFARRQRLKPAVLSLTRRAEDIRELLEASLGGAVKLVIDIPASVWPVEVDSGELQLALLNLAVNARDAMPRGGTLTISARNVRLGSDVGDAELEGEFVVLSVRDTGVGIPPDILPRVFEPFFTTKDVSRGAGLGLSQVYGFVEQSGGRATASSELGGGASFDLYLPRSDKSVSGAAEPAETYAAPGGARVLVVEDNPAVAEVAASLLEQLGSEVRVVGSAEAALRALQDGEPPDVVFSDIVMAGEMDGLALARRLRAERPELPILLTTGYSQNAAYVGDEFTILPKPYALPELSRALGEVIAKSRARRA